MDAAFDFSLMLFDNHICIHSITNRPLSYVKHHHIILIFLIFGYCTCTGEQLFVVSENQFLVTVVSIVL